MMIVASSIRIDKAATAQDRARLRAVPADRRALILDGPAWRGQFIGPARETRDCDESTAVLMAKKMTTLNFLSILIEKVQALTCYGLCSFLFDDSHRGSRTRSF